MAEIKIKTSYIDSDKKEIIPKTNELVLTYDKIEISILCEDKDTVTIIPNCDMKEFHFDIILDDYINESYYHEDIKIIKTMCATIQIKGLSYLYDNPEKIITVFGTDRKYHYIF